MTGRALLFLFNAIETNFLRASSTSEFSHSLVWGLSCQVLLQLYVLRCSRFGIVDPRGAHARARCSRRNLVFGWAMRDPDHEATIRFCGEAPRRRAHSGHGFKPWLCPLLVGCIAHLFNGAASDSARSPYSLCYSEVTGSQM